MLSVRAKPSGACTTTHYSISPASLQCNGLEAVLERNGAADQLLDSSTGVWGLLLSVRRVAAAQQPVGPGMPAWPSAPHAGACVGLPVMLCVPRCGLFWLLPSGLPPWASAAGGAI